MENTFKKGQSVNIKGVIGLILDNGMDGTPFKKTYIDKLVRWYSTDRKRFITVQVGPSSAVVLGVNRNGVSYGGGFVCTLLIGDIIQDYHEIYLEHIKGTKGDV